jgi:acetyl-CoA carboxylase biotin carboxyl carrier protein
VQQPYPQAPQPAPAPPAPKPQAEPAQSEAPASEAKAEDSNYLEVRSPIVGTFYRSSSPEKPPYVKVGDAIEVGQVVCIVEAMKLFNEIESEIAGKIVKVMVEDAQPVEYDQVLFLVDPKG